MKRRHTRLASRRRRGLAPPKDNPPTQSIERAWNGLRNDDVVAARRSDGLYELRQFVDDEFVMVRLGGHDRRSAEKAAVELAKREQSNAWVEEGRGSYRLLDMWR